MRSITITCCTLLVLAANAAAATLEEVRAAIAEAYKNMKGYSAEFQMTQDMDFGQGAQMSSKSSGKMIWKRAGDKLLFRTEIKSVNTQDFSGQKQEMESTTVSVCDGEYVYTLSDSAGQQHAMKMKMKAEEDMFDPGAMFDSLKEFGEFKVAGEEDVDGSACYVIEATAKADQEGPAPFVRQKLWFRKDIGIAVQMAGYDGAGKEVMKAATKGVKINPEIDDAQFVFKAPEGVEVVDMDAMSQQAPPAGHP